MVYVLIYMHTLNTLSPAVRTNEVERSITRSLPDIPIHSPVVDLHGNERDELVALDLRQLPANHVRHLIQVSHLTTR